MRNATRSDKCDLCGSECGWFWACWGWEWSALAGMPRAVSTISVTVWTNTGFGILGKGNFQDTAGQTKVCQVQATHISDSLEKKQHLVLDMLWVQNSWYRIDWHASGNQNHTSRGAAAWFTDFPNGYIFACVLLLSLSPFWIWVDNPLFSDLKTESE